MMRPLWNRALGHGGLPTVLKKFPNRVETQRMPRRLSLLEQTLRSVTVALKAIWLTGLRRDRRRREAVGDSPPAANRTWQGEADEVQTQKCCCAAHASWRMARPDAGRDRSRH